MEFLLNLVVRSLLLAALAGVGLWICRVKSAQARHAVWTLVTAGMLLQVILIPVLPAVWLRVLHPAVPVLAPTVSGEDSPVVVVAYQSPERRMSVEQVVRGVYAMGVSWCLAQLAFAWRFTRKLVRESAALGGRRFESRRISVPVTVGRKILLPTDWREWDAAKLAAVLAHEEAHVARKDWAVAAMTRVNRCVFWFHPLAWWLERELSRLAEQACDDAALAVVGDREKYASVLMEMARAAGARGGRIAGAVAMAKEANVEKRIDRILDASRRIPMALGRAGWVALSMGGALLVYMAAAVQLAPAQSNAEVAGQNRVAVPDATAAPTPGMARTPQPQPRPKPEPELLAQAVTPPSPAPDGPAILNDSTTGRSLSIPKIYNGRNKTFFFYTFGQDETVGTLRGTVLDPSGARVPSATVTIQGADGSRVLTTSANDWGEWSLHLPVGSYSLEVQKQGFVTYRQSGMRLSGGVTLLTTTNLEVGTISELVTISAAGTPRAEPSRSQDIPRVGGEVQLGKRVKMVYPLYPALARDRGITGYVLIEALIGKSGKVLQATVVNDAPEELKDAAITAVQQWEYAPALLNGEPVDTLTTITLSFQLSPQ